MKKIVPFADNWFLFDIKHRINAILLKVLHFTMLLNSVTDVYFLNLWPFLMNLIKIKVRKFNFKHIFKLLHLENVKQTKILQHFIY